MTLAIAPHESGLPDTRVRTRAYAQARRHSSKVRWLKTLIPIGAGIATLLILAVTYFNPFGRIGLTLGPMSMSGTKVAMEGPRLTGFKKDARPYEVTAKAAYQDIRKPTVIELKDMKARLVIDDTGGAAHLVSTTGLFDTQREWLDLAEDIRITTDKGDAAWLKTASVDFKAGTVVSKDPVKITMTSGQIEAGGLQVSDNGKVIVFTGRVHALIRRSAVDKKADMASSSPVSSEAESVKP